MQITASIHQITVTARKFRERGDAQVYGHKRTRSPLHLPWQFNLAVAGLISLGITAGVWLQM